MWLAESNKYKNKYDYANIILNSHPKVNYL